MATNNNAWQPMGIGVAVLLVVALVAGGYLYGRDGNRGDGNDIRIDLPGGKGGH